MKRFALPAALIAAVACGKKEGGDSSESAPAVVGAAVATVTAQRFVESVDAVGTVAVRPGHLASLSAPAPARVAATNVAAGARVSAGDALVVLDQAPFEAAVKSADAALTAAEKAAERAQRLADQGVAPRKDAEAANAELAKARLDASTAHRMLDLATIRSPIAGVVTRMNAMLGASVDAGQSLVEVADPAALDVNLTLSLADAARVSVGQSVVFHAEANATGEPVAAGTVADVALSVDSTNRGVPIRVMLPATARGVRIGETVFGHIAIAEHANAIVIPAEALVPDAEAFKVFVVEGGIAQSRAVTVGGRSSAGVWITNGLKAGEQIVTQGAYGVSDSAKVETSGNGKADAEPKKEVDTKPGEPVKKTDAASKKS